jgi:hypothetical protein
VLTLRANVWEARRYSLVSIMVIQWIVSPSEIVFCPTLRALVA